MTDGVSFDQHGNHGHGERRPKRKGPSLFVMLLLAFLAFTFIKRLKPKPSSNPTSVPERRQARPEGDSGTLGRPTYKFEDEQSARSNSQSQASVRPSNGDNSDWSMEEVEIARPRQTENGRPTANKTKKGDWSLEEVDVE